MTNSPMLMTINAHQTNLSLLKQFYLSPTLFTGADNAKRADTVCHMSVFGPTSHRFNGLDANCDRVLCYRDLRTEVEELKRDPSVKKVFIEFDGPGGEASGCFDLADYIADLAKVKPVVGFINGASYSANYALASACTELYASPYSMGGSIGAIYSRREIVKENETITYFTTGAAKADGAPETTLSDKEKERNQAMVDQLGESFFALVAKNRGINAASVKALQANIFSSTELLTHRLIDGIKTEEEIKTMMTNARHNKIVADINAAHENEKTQMTATISELQASVQQQGETQAATVEKINNLAISAGMPELAGQLIVEGADEESAASKLKAAAAIKDEEISLTSGLEKLEDESFDMEQLIKDA